MPTKTCTQLSYKT